MPDKNPNAVSGFYDGIFHYYDAANAFLTLGLHGRWRKKAARLALAGNPERLLDVCCGTGDMSMELRRLSGGRTSVTGLDFNGSMLSKARLKEPRGKFILGEAGSLPFPDGSFDALTISFATRNLAYGGKGLPEYFKEFNRVLRPGGVFVNIETSRPAGRLLRFLFHSYVRLAAAPVRLLSGKNGAAYGFLAGTIMVFHAPEELSKLIREAGFSKVEVFPLMFGAIAIHKAVK